MGGIAGSLDGAARNAVRSETGARGVARVSRRAARNRVQGHSTCCARISLWSCTPREASSRLPPTTRLRVSSVDEWPEFIPDPFHTAAIGFHYDAPGARPPQSIVLALPPRLHQESWRFDDVLDVLHEAWDLARLRGVRPRDLEGGLGLLLPGNYLPQSYTDDLPSVQLLKAQRDARDRMFKTELTVHDVIALGKV